MGQFQLHTPPAATLPRHPYWDLDDFAKGYVEAMFFTNGDTGDENESRLNDLGVERLTRSSVERIKADCERFLGHLMPDGCFARQWIDRLIEGERARYGDGVTDDQRAGHMYWYARQGHGVGWDDDYASEQAVSAIADGLQAACRKFGECSVWVHRSWIHCR